MSNGMVNEGKTRFENYFTLVLSYANEPVFFKIPRWCITKILG